MSAGSGRQHVREASVRVAVQNRLESDGGRQEVVRLIAQFLQDEGLHASSRVLLDEAAIVASSRDEATAVVRRLRECISDGHWNEAITLGKRLAAMRPGLEGESMRALTFAIHKQHYLELLERREYQQAFNHLTTRMKEKTFEKGIGPSEMRDLAYAVTCQAPQDVDAFADWDPMAGRAQLIDQLDSATEMLRLSHGDAEPSLPPKRLRQLMEQAVLHQYGKFQRPEQLELKFESLLEDIRAVVIPNVLRATLGGHSGNVKCIDFDRLRADKLWSGSSDATVRVWDVINGTESACFRGHKSRVWDVSSFPSGKGVSASADATLKVWDPNSESCVDTLLGHESDVYSVQVHPGGNHVVSCGYDKTVRLFDARRSKQVRLLEGHELAVSKVVFNSYGNLIFSGSKDCCVKVWDIGSGTCVNTIAAQFAEISSIDVNDTCDQIIVATKSNANVLLDLRMNRVLRRLRGHQNSTLHFVQASFGPARGFVSGGSEDGRAFIWDASTGEIVKTLDGHEGAVYGAAWSEAQTMLATCSEDETIKLWEFNVDGAVAPQ